MPKRKFEHSAKHDFHVMAQHDPSILTWRHCTSKDVWRLGELAGFDHIRAKRAFTLQLFRRTTYLTLSLDPAFEPKQECRETAQRLLNERAARKARAKQPLPAPKLAETVIKPKKRPARTAAKIARYSF